jgi:DNA modification methylase
MLENDYLDKIICGDSLTVMRQMPDRCLDLTVTSPPYNLKNSTSANYFICRRKTGINLNPQIKYKWN